MDLDIINQHIKEINMIVQHIPVFLHGGRDNGSEDTHIISINDISMHEHTPQINSEPEHISISLMDLDNKLSTNLPQKIEY